MSDIGTDVGQKMRLAIKAKLTELNCYVDDELPDYIMVMIANKRTKAQMKEDLNLFLAAQTSFFVEWLHIVLKKLKQVQVTNPNVFKNPAKRKSNEYILSLEDKKKIKMEEGKIKKEKIRLQACGHEQSLTDDLPISASSLSGAGRRKIVLEETPNNSINCAPCVCHDDEFDIPLLSEINASNEEELEILEKRIKNVKCRLGLVVESEQEEEENDCLAIKPDPGDQMGMEMSEPSRTPPPRIRRIIVESSSSKKTSELELLQLEKEKEMKRSIHARITFDRQKDSLKSKYESILKLSSMHSDRPERPRQQQVTEEHATKKRSILERLGKRPESKRFEMVKSKITKPSDERSTARIRSRDKESKQRRIDVQIQSKVSIPLKKVAPKEVVKELSESEETKINLKNVESVVKVKPRIMPAKTKQANPNLLFKAVAEAQRSVSQTPAVGEKQQNTLKIEKKANVVENQREKAVSAPALFTKKYKELAALKEIDKEKQKLRDFGGKKTIIINKNKKAKLLENDKLKLRILLTQNSRSQLEIQKPKLPADSEVDEDSLQLQSAFTDDFDDYDGLELDVENEVGGKSDVSPSRTPELPMPKPKEIDEKSNTELFKRNIQLALNAVSTDEEKGKEKSQSANQLEEQSLRNEVNHKFIVTLDGIDKSKYCHLDEDTNTSKIAFPDSLNKKFDVPTLVKVRRRRTPSPILFECDSKPINAVAPTKTIRALPKPMIIKKSEDYIVKSIGSAAIMKMKLSKEKCKFFPNCRQGNGCEFLHSSACKMFPNCKFADECLYAHPICKFETSCTRKNCPYSHGTGPTSGIGATNSLSTCKYFPNCSNVNCSFYHPKMCKYGLHCKNKLCVFPHPGSLSVGSGSKLSWRPNK